VKIITPATTEPVSLVTARLQCKVDAEGSPPTHVDDPLLELFTTAAREWVEAYLGAIVAPTTVQTELDDFPSDDGDLTLESGPVLDVQSITYTDDNGDPQTVDEATYTLDTRTEPAVLRLLDGESWPTDVGTVNAGIKVNYVVGYSGDADSPMIAPLPKSIKVAILLILAHLYRNRENSTVVSLQTIPFGATALLGPLKRKMGFA